MGLPGIFEKSFSLCQRTMGDRLRKQKEVKPLKDEAIIAAIAAGDPEGMAACMKQYARLLWPIASAVLSSAGSEQDVEECVADAFIYLWEHPEKFDPSRGKLKTLLCVVARSRAVDRYRALNRRRTVSLEEVVLADSFGMQEALLEAETRKELAAAVQALGEPGREILIRRYYDNQKPREIALAMNMSVKQVDNSLYRSKRQLREVLAGKIGGKL